MQQINECGTALLHIMQAFTTGTITGANMAVRYACWTSANAKSFINKSTAAVCIHCGIATVGASSQGRERIKLGQKFYSNAMDQDSSFQPAASTYQFFQELVPRTVIDTVGISFSFKIAVCPTALAKRALTE